MSLKGAPVTVAATATAIAAGADDRDGLTVIVQNPSGGAVVYLGASNVTASAYGYALAVGASLELTLRGGESLYGIVATGTQVVNVLKLGANA